MTEFFCPQCGGKNPANTKFCIQCGFKFQQNDQGPTSFQTVKPPQQPTSKYDPNSAKSHIQPQNDSLPVNYANFGDRFLAYLIDAIVFAVIGYLLSFLIYPGGARINFDFVSTVWNSSWPSTIISFLYLFSFEAFNDGRTIGKMVLKIKTVDDKTFQKINTKQAALHVLGKVLFLPIDIIIGAIAKEKTTLGENQIRITQRISQTSVIKIE